MGLLSLKTDLKSLKYGLDRRGMGSSKEPFITKGIPEGETPGATRDVLLRQGSIVSSANDVSRLTQLFTTTRGLSFIANQNILSRGSVKTEATLGPAYGGGNINQGVYLPTSTLAQAAVGFTGTHLNLLGLDPSSPIAGVVEGGLFPNGGLIRYEQAAFDFNKNNLNRLVKLKEDKIDLDPNATELLSYGGGPGSVLGVGQTRIKRFSNTTGINPYGNPEGGFKLLSQTRVNNSLTYFNENSPSGSISEITYGAGSPNILVISSSVSSSIKQSEIKVAEAKTYFNNNFPSGSISEVTYGAGSDNSLASESSITSSISNSGVKVAEAKTYFNDNSPSGSISEVTHGVVADNKVVTLKNAYPTQTTKATDEGGTSRVINSNPKYTNYKYGNLDSDGNLAGDFFNKINTDRLNKGTDDPSSDQLFKFYLNPITPDFSSDFPYIYWQAYIESFSDQVGAEHDSFTYVGRGYPSFKYKGFSREISMDFTIVSHNPTQISHIYNKLNELIALLSPNYSNSGYLRGNFFKLTFGDYLTNIPGILKGFSLSPIFEAGFDDGRGENSSGYQLAKAIKVSGFNFTPIADNTNNVINRTSQFIYNEPL